MRILFSPAKLCSDSSNYVTMEVRAVIISLHLRKSCSSFCRRICQTLQNVANSSFPFYTQFFKDLRTCSYECEKEPQGNSRRNGKIWGTVLWTNSRSIACLRDLCGGWYHFTIKKRKCVNWSSAGPAKPAHHVRSTTAVSRCAINIFWGTWSVFPSRLLFVVTEGVILCDQSGVKRG